ncbi:MAG: PstS family phosphate ABC transporter substrate-binding protein [Verrucomicrobiota bacterium]|nr:PstS family phosphate ABC transporter substrate-binding protein [Verrucomicrobiota bacterium]
MIKKFIRTVGFATFALAATSLNAAEVGKITIDSGHYNYKTQSGISGKLASMGSDTLNNLMTLWAEGFRKYYPNVNIEIEGKGSSTAPPALIKGTAQLGPMSRKMKASEVDEFEKAYGYKPRLVGVAIDGLAVYVNKDNPLESLTLQQVDTIFSSTYKRGGKASRTWGDLGLTGEWANRPISLFGRNSASGTYGFFKDVALKGGDYSSSVKEQPGSASVVQGIEKELGAVGYSGIGYKTSGVKALAIADKGEPVTLTQRSCESFKYPIARYLYVYINAPPTGVDPLTKEFIRYVLSKQGQEVVVKDGYFPLTTKQSNEFLTSSSCK